MIIILSHYFWSLNKWEAHMQTVVIPTPFTWFGCKCPQIKADSLQLKHILFVSLKSIVVVYRAKNVRIVSMSQYLWTWLYVCLETQIHWCSIQIQWSLLLKTDLKTTSICPKKLLIYIYPLNIFQNGLKTKEEKTFSKILKRIKNMKSLFRTINISSTYVPLKRSQQTTPRNQRQRFPPPATITHTHKLVFPHSAR